MKTLRLFILLLLPFLLSGCTFHLSILSNNNLLTTRSQATGLGNPEGLVEGGGSPTLEASFPIK